ncbi:MAG: hypothetical protein AABY83_10865 [Pseudomonadota bacterium]
MRTKIGGKYSVFMACLPVVLVWMLTPSAADAADGSSREREALRRMQLVQQKNAQEKLRLETEKSALEQTVARLTAQLDKQKKSDLQNSKEKAELNAQMDALRHASEELKTKLDGEQIKQSGMLKDLDQLRAQLEDVENRRKQSEGLVLQRTKTLDQCEKKNVALYNINNEILKLYRDKGLLEVLLLSEPITKIQQVKEYGIVEEYKEKLENQLAKE